MVEGLRTNGSGLRNIENFPFMLSVSKHGKLLVNLMITTVNH